MITLPTSSWEELVNFARRESSLLAKRILMFDEARRAALLRCAWCTQEIEEIALTRASFPAVVFCSHRHRMEYIRVYPKR